MYYIYYKGMGLQVDNIHEFGDIRNAAEVMINVKYFILLI